MNFVSADGVLVGLGPCCCEAFRALPEGVRGGAGRAEGSSCSDQTLGSECWTGEYGSLREAKQSNMILRKHYTALRERGELMESMSEHLTKKREKGKRKVK